MGPRDESFDYAPHVPQTTWAGLRADVSAAVAWLRADRGTRAMFSVGFCFGGRLAFALASRAELELDGVIGFYGVPIGAGRNDVPAPVDLAAEMASPVLGIFGGTDAAIPPDAIEAFDGALTGAGVEHSLITYPKAPHSFFDRKQAQFVDASAAAWGELLDFIGRHTPAS